MGPEATIEQGFREVVEAGGDFCIKLDTERGLPDRLVLVRVGHGKTPRCAYFFVEFKAPDGRLTKAQKFQHERLKDAGAVVLVANDLDEAVSFYKAVKKYS